MTHFPCPRTSLQPFPPVDQLSDIQDVTQVWYDDDAYCAGSLTFICKWSHLIKFLGPAYGYDANDCKMWLIAKELYRSNTGKLSPRSTRGFQDS